MKKPERKLSKRLIAIIVTVAAAAVIVVSLLITNIFIPVRYLTAYCVSTNKNTQGTLRVNFIDVDFGDCTLIELPDGKTVLIDGGDGSYPNMLKVLRFLNSRGVNGIDYLICTSVADEHCGGLAEIVRLKEVRYAYIPHCLNTHVTAEYRSFVTALEEREVPNSIASVGEGIVSEEYGYFLTFLSPSNYLSPKSEYADLNEKATTETIENASAVTYLNCNGRAFVFTSDVRNTALKRVTEEFIVCEQLGQPYCRVGDNSVNLREVSFVTAPAHAGKNNTYAPWYDLIKPKETVISVGKSFADYPSLTALSDICNYCKPYYTMYDGDITFTVNGGEYAVTKSKN